MKILFYVNILFFILTSFLVSSSHENVRKRKSLLFSGGVFGRGGCTQFVHGRSRMAIDPRVSTMTGRSTSGFHQPGRHCLHQARSAVRCSTSRTKGELHPVLEGDGGGYHRRISIFFLLNYQPGYTSESYPNTRKSQWELSQHEEISIISHPKNGFEGIFIRTATTIAPPPRRKKKNSDFLLRTLRGCSTRRMMQLKEKNVFYTYFFLFCKGLSIDWWWRRGGKEHLTLGDIAVLELVLKPAIPWKKSWGGYRRTPHRSRKFDEQHFFFCGAPALKTKKCTRSSKKKYPNNR